MKKVGYITVAVVVMLLAGYVLTYSGDNSCDKAGKILGENTNNVSACELPECMPGEAGGVAVKPCYSSNPDEVEYWD